MIQRDNIVLVIYTHGLGIEKPLETLSQWNEKVNTEDG